MKNNYFLIFLLLLSITPVFCQTNSPKANSKAIVISDNARFTVLTNQLIRMEWSDNGKFEDLASLVFINRNLPVPKFSTRKKAGWLIINTEELQLRYKINSGKFSEANLDIRFLLNGKQVKWLPGMKDSLNLKGTTRTLDATDGEKDVKLEDGLLSRSGWFLLDDTKTCLFDSTNWVAERNPNGQQDWYFFGYGHEYKKVLLDYTQLAGKIPMPPKYAFGYWWSRYWTYSDEELRKLIQDMRLHHMPIDVLVIDMDWHNTYSLSLVKPQKDEFGEMIGWTGYSWNNQLFPQPKKFLDWTQQQNLKTALNLHPASGIAPMENVYFDFAKAYGFDTAQHKNIPFKIEDKKWVDIYFDKVLHPLEAQGIDFWWLDWQQWLENKSVKNLSNTSWLNHVFFTDMEKNGTKRPLLFHRWGGMGNHRYQIGFSGDSHSSWDALDFQSYFTATASNVGYGYWSHDIGGHIGDDPDPELYLRWIQFGVFSPILRTHCSKSKDIERRMFMYPNHYNMMLDALQMRYALNPYIYNASRYGYDTGVSLCRPMYYDYPEDQQAYQYTRQYMFGNDMIVAPIASKSESNMSLKRLWLPRGEWYELYSGTMLEGNKEYVRSYCLNEVPVFVKAGTIIPMYPKTIKNLQVVPDTLVLCFVPGAGKSLKIYEDDGTTSDYKNNKCAYTTVNKEIQENGVLKINILPTEGYFAGMKTKLSYELSFPCTYPPQEVVVNKLKYACNNDPQTASWTYDAEKLTVRIFIPETSRKENIEVTLSPQQKTKSQEKHISGKIGIIGRAPFILEKMKYALNGVDPFANLTNNITKIGSLKSDIQYNPQNTLEILTDYDASYPQLISDIKNYTKIDETELKEVLKLFVYDVKILSNPVIQIPAGASDEPVKVQMSTNVPGAMIYYTTDNSIPTEKSILYKGEFILGKTCEIKAKCFKDADMQSNVTATPFQRTFAKTVNYKYNYNVKYDGGSSLSLADGIFGTEKDFVHKWVGFECVDMIATVELKKLMSIKSITARFLESNSQWIFAPVEVTYELSRDGVNYKKVFYLDRRDKSLAFHKEDRIIPVTANFDEIEAEFIRVTAKNMGICPAWHYGSGGNAWLFTDELIVE